VDTSVTPGASYTYFVRATLPNGTTRDSTTASATASTCGTVAPGPFTLTASAQCSGGAGQITLNWTVPSGVGFYQVVRGGHVLTEVNTPAISYIDTTVVIGTSYTYTIRAINSGGSTDSNPVTLTAQCDTIPGPFTVTVDPTCVNNAPVNLVSWTGASSTTVPSYDLYRNDFLVFSTQFNNYTDTAVTGGTSYTYRVRAKNTVGFRDSSTVGIAKSDCAAPLTPTISAITPMTATVGDPAFSLTITGTNFDSTTKILWAFSGQTPTVQITPTFVNSTTLTAPLTPNNGGFSGFQQPGAYAIRVITPGPAFWDGQLSNVVSFTVLNPTPVVSSISGTCQADLNCTPSNGFDVRIFGSGFVWNTTTAGQKGTTVQINGSPANNDFLGQGPVYSQMRLLANGALIPSPGTYSLQVCNAGTAQGTVCSTGSLTVTP
jgi:hypothetical protein